LPSRRGGHFNAIDPVRGSSFPFHRLFGWWSATGGSLRSALRAAAHHTGLPIVLVAALALVVVMRTVKRGARFAFEVLIAVACLAAATRLGWIRW
jgi:hypothetical protein